MHLSRIRSFPRETFSNFYCSTAAAGYRRVNALCHSEEMRSPYIERSDVAIVNHLRVMNRQRNANDENQTCKIAPCSIRREWASRSDQATMASASTSTSISGSINRFTSTIVVAGRISPNISPCARPTSCH